MTIILLCGGSVDHLSFGVTSYVTVEMWQDKVIQSWGQCPSKFEQFKSWGRVTNNNVDNYVASRDVLIIEREQPLQILLFAGLC